MIRGKIFPTETIKQVDDRRNIESGWKSKKWNLFWGDDGK